MKKIMFNDKYDLTKAVLEGRKTQTRRFFTLNANQYVRVVALDNGSFFSYVAQNGKPSAFMEEQELPEYDGELSPAYFIGEEVAVAQKYSELEYGVDWVRHTINKEHAGWNNKMFVSAEEMPHRIKITNIRIERLQDISDEDCLKEGISTRGDAPLDFYVYGENDILFDTPRRAFASMIDAVSGKGTWDSNPYVFVYDFELIKRIKKTKHL